MARTRITFKKTFDIKKLCIIDGMWGDAYFVVTGNDFPEKMKTARWFRIYRDWREVKVESFIKDTFKKTFDEYIQVKNVREFDFNGIKLLELRTRNKKCYIQKKYYDFIVNWFFCNPVIKIVDDKSPVLFFDNNKLLGIAMPYQACKG